MDIDDRQGKYHTLWFVQFQSCIHRLYTTYKIFVLCGPGTSLSYILSAQSSNMDIDDQQGKYHILVFVQFQGYIHRLYTIYTIFVLSGLGTSLSYILSVQRSNMDIDDLQGKCHILLFVQF